VGTGYLKVKATTKSGNLPVKADISITHEDQIIHEIHTNKSGVTDKVPLEAPPKEEALDPNFMGIPYASYSVMAQAKGFTTVVINGVRIFDTIVSILPINMEPKLDEISKENTEDNKEEYHIQVHKLIEQNEYTSPPETQFFASEIQIPGYINLNITHNEEKRKYTKVAFMDYIKYIASLTIYPSWPPAAIEANIYAIISLTLHDAYSPDYNITSNQLENHVYANGSQVYDSIVQIVDNIFNRYIKRKEESQPLYSVYSDGRFITCPGLWQWGSVSLAKRGYNALEILRHYYPNDVEIIETDNIMGFEPFPGYTLQEGMSSKHVQLLHVMLSCIRINYTAITEVNPDTCNFGADTTAAIKTFQEIFMLELDQPTGIVDKNTWYSILSTNTNLRKSRRQPSGKSAALSRFSRCVIDDDFRESYNVDCIHNNDTSFGDETQTKSKEQHISRQLITMYMLSQIYAKHAGNYI